MLDSTVIFFTLLIRTHTSSTTSAHSHGSRSRTYTSAHESAPVHTLPGPLGVLTHSYTAYVSPYRLACTSHTLTHTYTNENTSAMAIQTIEGIVTKAGVMAKTVTMTVKKVKVHPKLLKVRSCAAPSGSRKSYVRHKKYLVHDPEEKLSIGERIRAQACRPLSARKRFALLESLGFAQRAPAGADAVEAERLRRERAEAAMSADQREWLRIEERVRETQRMRSK